MGKTDESRSPVSRPPKSISIKWKKHVSEKHKFGPFFYPEKATPPETESLISQERNRNIKMGADREVNTKQKQLNLIHGIVRRNSSVRHR